MRKINHLTLLFIVAVLLFCMFFNHIYTGYIPFLVLLSVAFATTLFSLFLIHRPILCLRLTIYNSIILLAFQIWIGYILLFALSGPVKLPLTAIFPLICIILNILSINILRNLSRKILRKI